MKQVSSLTRSLTENQVAHSQERSCVHRIYTEEKSNLPGIVARYFDGATILSGVGLWQGQTEDCAVIEIIAPRRDRNVVDSLALVIKAVNKQSAVLVTTSEVESAFVGQ